MPIASGGKGHEWFENIEGNACFNSQNNDYYFRPFNVFSFDILLSPLHSKVFHSLFFQFKVLKVFWTKFFGKIKNVLCCQGYMKILIYFYSIILP